MVSIRVREVIRPWSQPEGNHRGKLPGEFTRGEITGGNNLDPIVRRPTKVGFVLLCGLISFVVSCPLWPHVLCGLMFFLASCTTFYMLIILVCLLLFHGGL